MLIPYKCRCEALGENKRRGGLYKSLKTDSELKFTINKSWKNGHVFICNLSQSAMLNGNALSPADETDITALLNFSGVNTISANNAFIVKRPEKFVKDAEAYFENDKIIVSMKAGANGFPPVFYAELYDENLALVNKIKAEDSIVSFNASETNKEYTILLSSDDECLKLKLPDNKKDSFNKSKLTNLIKGSNNGFEIKPVGKNPKLFEIINNSESIPEKLSFEILNQSDITYNGEIKLPEIKPGAKTVIKLDFDFPSLSFFEYFIKININDTTKLFKLPNTQSEPENYYSEEMSDIEIKETDEAFVFSGCDGNDFEAIISKTTGRIISLARDGKTLIKDDVGAENTEEIYMIEKTPKYATLMARFATHSVFYAIYGDGEIGLSVMGNKAVEIPLAKGPERIYYFGKTDEIGIYDEKLSETDIDEMRFCAIYGESLSGVLIKAMPTLNASINESKIILSGGEMYSATIRLINMDEEDIVREARTLPAI